MAIIQNRLYRTCGRTFAWMVFLALIATLVWPDTAEAAGKGKVNKQLTAISQTLGVLSAKSQARGLFSAEEEGQLVNAKLELLELMKDQEGNAAMAKPLYQAAWLYQQREWYQDALDTYSYLVKNFGDTPYASRAKVELPKLQKLLGINEPAAKAGSASSGAK